MSSDEEDYMSEVFLSKCEDKRPGLVPQHKARQYKQEARVKELNKTNRIKPRKVLEAEKREEGLNKTISSNNKGFAMLQRMGFKPGMTLGKKGDGRSEPVPIEVKAGRGGLGHDAEVFRKRTAASAARVISVQKRQKMEENNRMNFRERQRSVFAEKRAERDLYKSQKVCEQLDSQNEITEPSEPFFWPAAYLKKNEPEEESETEEEEDKGNAEEDKEEEETEEEEETLGAGEKLEILTMYLRNKHVYCVWCGTTFNDKDDLKANCPGDTAEAHDD